MGVAITAALLSAPGMLVWMCQVDGRVRKESFPLRGVADGWEYALGAERQSMNHFRKFFETYSGLPEWLSKYFVTCMSGSTGSSCGAAQPLDVTSAGPYGREPARNASPACRNYGLLQRCSMYRSGQHR